MRLLVEAQPEFHAVPGSPGFVNCTRFPTTRTSPTCPIAWRSRRRPDAAAGGGILVQPRPVVRCLRACSSSRRCRIPNAADHAAVQRVPQLLATLNPVDWLGLRLGGDARVRALPSAGAAPTGHRADDLSDRRVDAQGKLVVRHGQDRRAACAIRPRHDVRPARRSRTLNRVRCRSPAWTRGLVFEREDTIFGQSFVQTLEPRAFYVYIPFRNQNQMPVFDTAHRRLQFRAALQREPLPRQRPHRRREPAHARADVAPARSRDRRRANARRRSASASTSRPAGHAERDAAHREHLRLPAAGEGRLSDAWALTACCNTTSTIRRPSASTSGVRYSPAPGKVFNASYRYSRQDIDPTGGVSRAEPVRPLRAMADLSTTGRCSGAGTTRSSTARRWRGWWASSTMAGAGCCGSSASG